MSALAPLTCRLRDKSNWVQMHSERFAYMFRGLLYVLRKFVIRQSSPRWWVTFTFRLPATDSLTYERCVH